MATTKTELTKLSIPEIKRELKTYDKDVLISMLIDCYKLSNDVKNYVHVLLNPEQAVDHLYDKAKETISQEFFPDKGDPKLRLSVARKAITEFKKFSNDEIKTIDLMIYYVELGVKIADAYGDMYERFYSSMESMYGDVVNKTIKNDSLLRLYRSRLEKIVHATNGMGWGFHDCLANMYYSHVHVDDE